MTEPGTAGTAGTAGQPGSPSGGGTGGAGGAGGAGGMGTQGDQGDTGERGERGHQGPRGDSMQAIKATDRRLLFLLLFVVVITGLFAYRSEVGQRHLRHAQDQIKHNAVVIADNAYKQTLYNYTTCLHQQTTVRKINDTTHAQITFLTQLVATAPKPADLRAYIQIYVGAILDVPDCGQRPVR